MRRRALCAASAASGGGGLITFFINDVEYQAEAGMTWGEWVESPYNTDGAYAVDDMDSSIAYLPDMGTWVGTAYYYVFQDEQIIANYKYSHVG